MGACIDSGWEAKVSNDGRVVAISKLSELLYTTCGRFMLPSSLIVSALATRSLGSVSMRCSTLEQRL